MGQKSDFRKIAKISAKVIEEKKGGDILILDVRKISDFTDYLVIASGTSDTHIRTLFNELDENLPISAYKKEMKNRPHWAVLDYGGVVIHIFHADTRKFYNLENNWATAKKVNFKQKKT